MNRRSGGAGGRGALRSELWRAAPEKFLHCHVTRWPDMGRVR